MVELVAVAAPQRLAFVVLQLVVQQQMELDFHSSYWAAMLPDLDLLRTSESNLLVDLQPVDDELVAESVDLKCRNHLLRMFSLF